LIYCYDAYCGWCYGFSPVIKKLEENYNTRLDFEVLSGGMILPEKPVHIKATAGFIAQAYKQVEDYSGIKFGQDYLWHIFNPEESDWFPNSEKPAIALCILKKFHPDKTVHFACDLQYALHYEGRDLTDDEAYRHLLPKYELEEEFFYRALHDPKFKEEAYEEFNIVKHLQVTGFPTVLIKTQDKFYLVARGYLDYDSLSNNVEKVLASLN
jgi:putative protein-disulfide isomerase